MDFELLEIRKGHYVKVIDGNVVGPATKGEISVYLISKEIVNIDPAIIEISLAFTALSAVLLAQPGDIIFKLLSGLIFYLSFIASVLLYTSYITCKIPIAWTRYNNSKSAQILRKLKIPGRFWLWLILNYPRQSIRVLLKKTTFDENTTEFGYITLYIALSLAGAVIPTYVFMT